MAHLSVRQRWPFKKSFTPSRRHSRHTASRYLAKTTSLSRDQIRLLFQTLLRLGGRHPLWGMGVTSLMARTSRPAVASARIADSRPAPGPFTRTSAVFMPWSRARFPARKPACCAAKGVPLREPLKPRDPALDQQTSLPSGSVTLTLVLLKVAWMWTTPTGTMRFSFFLKTFFLPTLVAAFAIGPRNTRGAHLPLCLCRGALLVSNRAFSRPLAGTRVRVGPLAVDRKVSTVAQATVGTHLDQLADVHCDFLPEIAFHPAFFLDDLPDPRYFFFREVLHFLIRINSGAHQDRKGAATPDPVNIRQADFGALHARQVNSSNACHSNLQPQRQSRTITGSLQKLD